MFKKGVEQKPSETALFAALYRAVANKEFKAEGFGPDYLAEYFLPPVFKFLIKFKIIRENIKKLTPGVYEYILARTAFFDDIFIDALNKKIPQIVLLGSGYDSRAYRFTKFNSATKIIELDTATTQARKKKCLKKAQIDFPEHVTLATIDFNKESLKNVLESAGYDSNEKTLFIWEGVSYYLKLESVDKTLELVSHASHHESAIAFDYTISVSENNINDYYGVKKFVQAMKKHHANEELIFSINEGEIESFLEQRGLKTVEHLDNEEIERTLLSKENGSLIGRITGHFRFVLASPKRQQEKKKPNPALT